MQVEKLATQPTAFRRTIAEPRYRGLQEYCNLEFRREESAWLVAQVRATRTAAAGPIPRSGSRVLRWIRSLRPSLARKGSSAEAEGGTGEGMAVETA